TFAAIGAGLEHVAAGGLEPLPERPLRFAFDPRGGRAHVRVPALEQVARMHPAPAFRAFQRDVGHRFLPCESSGPIPRLDAWMRGMVAVVTALPMRNRPAWTARRAAK